MGRTWNGVGAGNQQRERLCAPHPQAKIQGGGFGGGGLWVLLAGGVGEGGALLLVRQMRDGGSVPLAVNGDGDRNLFIREKKDQ